MPRVDRELLKRFERRKGICDFDLGGPSAPSPDPAIGKAAEANAEIGKEALDFSKQQYADSKTLRDKYQPVIDNILQQQVRVGDKNEAAGDDYLNYMKTTFRPIEQGLAKDANDFDTEAKRAELAGKASSDVEQAAGVSDASARRDAARYGVNPGDAAFSENLAGNSLNKTIMKVGAMNTARTQARAEGRAFKFDVAGLGRNLPGAGATASGLALNAGNAAAGTSQIPGATARADTGVASQGYNTAMASNQSAGNLYSGVFDSNMRRYQADQQANAAMYGGLGTIAGMGTYAAIMSSKTVKVKKGDVSAAAVAEKVKKLPIDRWKYKKEASNDQAEHVGTYAEDFKEAFGVGDGKVIPIIDAIGITMAAIKGVAQQVDRVESKVARFARRGVTA